MKMFKCYWHLVLFRKESTVLSKEKQGEICGCTYANVRQAQGAGTIWRHYHHLLTQRVIFRTLLEENRDTLYNIVVLNFYVLISVGLCVMSIFPVFVLFSLLSLRLMLSAVLFICNNFSVISCIVHIWHMSAH